MNKPSESVKDALLTKLMKEKGENKSTENDLTVDHVIVLHHGFLGNSYDMRLIENVLSVDYPTNFKVKIQSL